VEIQTKFGEQSTVFTPEMWAQFMALQSPVLQSLMGENLDQSKNIFSKMQEEMQKQTGQMLGVFGIKS
jgi:polyhydroxyalkanoate synthesis regulator protein